LFTGRHAPGVPAAAHAPRRSQEERSADTQRRVLDACLDCLVTEGWSGTTTTAVAARAGVSRGAQLHHFPTRHALVSAAVRHLFDRLRDDFETAFASETARRGRAGAGLDLLWRVFQDERLLAVLELYVAARTDAALRAELVPVAEAHHRHVLELAFRFFPEASRDRERFESLLDLVLDALQGMAVRRLLRPDDPAIPRTLHGLERLAGAALASLDAPDGRPA